MKLPEIQPSHPLKLADEILNDPEMAASVAASDAELAESSDADSDLAVSNGPAEALQLFQRKVDRAFKPFNDEADRLIEGSKLLTADSPAGAKLAETMRKALKVCRNAANKRRLALNEARKQQTDLLNAAGNAHWDKCEAEEKRLKAIEDAAEIAEQARLDALVADRSAKVREAEGNPTHYALRDMDEAAFQEQLGNLLAGQAARKAAAIKALLRDRRCEQMEAILDRPIEQSEGDAWVEMTEIDFGAKLIEATTARDERIRLAEEARKAEESARDAQRIENERLRAEQVERERQSQSDRDAYAARLHEQQEAARIEREAAADRQREAEESARKEIARIEAEAAAELARVAAAAAAAEIERNSERVRLALIAKREREYAEQSAKAELDRAADEARKLREEKEERERLEQLAEETRLAAERAAAAAPDKEKLLAFASTLRTQGIPQFSDNSIFRDAMAIVDDAACRIEKIASNLIKPPKKGAKANADTLF